MGTPAERLTTVVNVRTEACDIYVGRYHPRFGSSVWGNPFKVGRDGDRYEVIAKYRAWIATRPDLLARLPELRGKRLGCWCAPEACHAEVLAELADGTTDAAH